MSFQSTTRKDDLTSLAYMMLSEVSGKPLPLSEDFVREDHWDFFNKCLDLKKKHSINDMAQDVGNDEIINFCEKVSQMGRFEKPDYALL
jgi:hypothetical protein